jgi:hypothetical protein
MDQQIFDMLFKKGMQYGLPPEVWYPIVMGESRGNPAAHTQTSKEDSRGLFQVNVYAHPDANSSKLFDPEYNADFQMPTLVRAYQKALDKGLTGVDATLYVSRYGQRPAWTDTVVQIITGHYNDYIKAQQTASTDTAWITPILPMPNPTDMLEEGEKKGIFPDGGADSIRAQESPFTWENIKLSFVTLLIFVLVIFSLFKAFAPDFNPVADAAGMVIDKATGGVTKALKGGKQ